MRQPGRSVLLKAERNIFPAWMKTTIRIPSRSNPHRTSLRMKTFLIMNPNLWPQFLKSLKISQISFTKSLLYRLVNFVQSLAKSLWMYSHSALALRVQFLPWIWFRRVSSSYSSFISRRLSEPLALEAKYPKCKFVFNHKGSAEIHPAKAAYIEKNFDSEAIFRDIIEIIPLEDKPKPHCL